MEQAAAPGTVLIAEETYRVVRPLFNFEEMGELEIRGKEGTVRAYRVLGRSAEAGRVRGIEGLHAEMVGRDVELQNLHDLVEDIRNRVGRIAIVLGEAGMGKTRLIREMQAYFNKIVGVEANWFETSSLSYENKHAYGLLQRLIRNVAGIGYDDPMRVVQKKLEGIVETFPEDVRRSGISVFEALFGVDEAREGASLQLDGEAFKSELLVVIETWWRTQFSDRPTVIVFDDMHLFVSTISKTQQQAMMTASFFFMIPMVFLSGFVFPIENMPAVVQPITLLVPLRYFLVIMRGIFLKGVGLETLWPQALALFAWGAVVLTLATLRSTKRLS
jgi:hypothetical protein